MQLITFMLQSMAFLGKQPDHDEHVSENMILEINNMKELKDAAETYNVSDDKNDMLLTNSRHNKGSLINFNKKITTSEFSAKLTLDHLILKDSEVSGVYFWFTEDKLTQGAVKNGPAVFKGFMGGLEFAHNKARFVFTYNHGEDYTDSQAYTTIYDKIDPTLIGNVLELSLKLIHTENNIKFELYDGDKLLSDTFKINDPELVKMDGAAYNLGLTSFYEDPKSETTLELNKIQVYEREEAEEYNNMELHTYHNTHMKTESDHTVVEVTANVAHFINYLTVALGGLGHSSMQKMVLSFKDDLKELSNRVDETIDEIKAGNNAPTDDGDTSEKLKQIETNMHEIYKVIKGLRAELDKMHMVHTKHHNVVGKGVICFGIFVTIATIAKLIYTSRQNERKTLKSLE